MSGALMRLGSALPIRVSNVSKWYEGFRALDDVTLEFPAGTVTALVGGSGSGKSTLLRCINGLTSFELGAIYVGSDRIGVVDCNGNVRGWNEAEASQIRRKIGVVFQQYNLFPHRTVLQNVTLAQEVVLHRSRDESVESARRQLERVGLLNKADAYPRHLSGGQQQRVAIARALAMEPAAILFDEATSALDPELSLEVLNIMRALAGEGITMIAVTHEMRFAREVANYVALIENGRLVEHGPAREIFEDPKDPRTHRFLNAFI